MSSKKSVVVTGAGAGIGRAVALAMGQAGHRVFLVDIDAVAVAASVAAVNASGAEADGFAASVADSAALEAAFKANDARFGRVDILVNSAGITGNYAATELDPDTWCRVVAINQTGTFFAAQAAGRRMIAAGGGVIINISSIYGLVAAPNRVAYSATKAAVAMMTKSLAVEWASAGVRVNCIAPGYVETPGTAALVESGKIDLEQLCRRTPQGRLAQPEDIANAILMICDDRMAHITGQVLAIDGGWTAYGYV